MLNEKDMKILTNLRVNARLPLSTLSRQTGIPASTLFDKIRAQERDVIRGYTSLLDFRRLGFGTCATILLNARDKVAVQEYLLSHPNVNNLHRLGNEYDFALEVIFRSEAELAGFVEHIRQEFGIEEIQISVIREVVKREEFMEY
jgi:DNA-binding Lrp family transcriptional regulator